MSSREGIRATQRAIVINTALDYCWTPVGGTKRLVGYHIFAHFDIAVRTEETVRMTRQEAFTTNSRIPNVRGDEAGTGGGITSGVNLGTCHPITSSRNVRAGKHHVIRHRDVFAMNCSGPDGEGNTVGKVYFITTNAFTQAILEMEKNWAKGPLADNFPYQLDTFNKIRELKDPILKYSSEYGVPPVVVAGSIADEYNTTLGPFGWLNDVQDALIGSLSNFALQVDIDYNPINSKLVNAAAHDIGPGNVRVETAWDLYNRHRDKFSDQSMNASDVVNYTMTDEGVSQMSALHALEAQQKYGDVIGSLSPEMQEAVLITGYKRGLEHYDPGKTINNDPFMPGEGIRAILQRDELLEALGLDKAEDKGGIRVKAQSLFSILPDLC